MAAGGGGVSVHPALAVLSTFREEGATDVTCHLGSWPSRLRTAASVADLRAYAARHGLRSMWVSHLSCLFAFDTRTGNEELLATCGQEDLFEVFAVLNPLERTWRAELGELLGRGAVGVRIAPSHLGHPLAAAVELAHACRERGVPLQVLVRLDDARVRHPRHAGDDPTTHEIAAFLKAARGTRLVISGLRRDEWADVVTHLPGSVLEVDSVLEHVVCDLWHVNGPFRVADALAADRHRWAFGSGFPVQTPEATILQLAASDLSPEVRRAITVGNAATALATQRSTP